MESVEKTFDSSDHDSWYRNFYEPRLRGRKHRWCFVERDATHDAYCCRTHREWLEKGCSDPQCEFCSGRPARPGGTPPEDHLIRYRGRFDARITRDGFLNWWIDVTDGQTCLEYDHKFTFHGARLKVWWLEKRNAWTRRK